jgi:hypothetical protein
VYGAFVSAGAGTIAVRTGSTDIVILGGGAILSSTSASDSAIVLASGRNFGNGQGSNALAAANGRWLVYSTNPANDTVGGLANDFRRFSCTFGGACPAFPATGNGLLYSYTPTLTATPAALGLTYGDAAPNLAGYGYTLSGYLGADASGDNVTGSLTGNTAYAQGSGVGSYNVNYASGSLTSSLGYGFTYANNATAITVGQRAITVPASLPVSYAVLDPVVGSGVERGNDPSADAIGNAPDGLLTFRPTLPWVGQLR